jgi:hypothetical protein
VRRSEIASFVLLALSLACGGGGDDTEVSIPMPAGSDEAPVEQQVAVRDLRIGTAVEEGRGIAQEATTFQPGDSVFLSAELDGTVEQLNVVARFTYQDGSIVGEEGRYLPLNGKEVVTFDLAPPGGLAPGRYRAELLLGNERVGEKEFTVGG